MSVTVMVGVITFMQDNKNFLLYLCFRRQTERKGVDEAKRKELIMRSFIRLKTFFHENGKNSFIYLYTLFTGKEKIYGTLFN